MNKIKKILSLIVIAVVAFSSAFLLSGTKVKAANNTDALTIGFQVDESKYYGFSKVYEKFTQVWVKDKNSTDRLVGNVKVSTMFAKCKEKYLLNNQEEVCMTRVVTEPVSCNYVIKELGIKRSIKLECLTDRVVMESAMPNNVYLSSSVATTPSNTLHSTVTYGTGIKLSAGITIKYITIGMGTGVSWADTTQRKLYSVSNDSNSTKFRVEYKYGGYDKSKLTEKEKSFCYYQNKFYAASYSYGSYEVMARNQGRNNVTVEFKDSYKINAFVPPFLGTRVVEIPVVGTAKFTIVNNNYY